MVIPARIGPPLAGAAPPSRSRTCVLDPSQSSLPIQIKNAPPTNPMKPATALFAKSPPRPNKSPITKASSNKPWPRTRRGPAQKPIRPLSPMVIVSKGPGIIAPDSPTVKAER